MADPTLPFVPYSGRGLINQVVRPASAVPGEDRRDPQWEDRIRRFTQQVSTLLNSLITQGILVESPPGTWKVVSGALLNDRAPTAADDSTLGAYRGAVWVDTSATPDELYFCTDATEDAAVWRGPF